MTQRPRPRSAPSRCPEGPGRDPGALSRLAGESAHVATDALISAPGPTCRAVGEEGGVVDEITVSARQLTKEGGTNTGHRDPTCPRCVRLCRRTDNRTWSVHEPDTVHVSADR